MIFWAEHSSFLLLQIKIYLTRGFHVETEAVKPGKAEFTLILVCLFCLLSFPLKWESVSLPVSFVCMEGVGLSSLDAYGVKNKRNCLGKLRMRSTETPLRQSTHTYFLSVLLAVVSKYSWDPSARSTHHGARSPGTPPRDEKASHTHVCNVNWLMWYTGISKSSWAMELKNLFDEKFEIHA